MKMRGCWQRWLVSPWMQQQIVSMRNRHKLYEINETSKSTHRHPEIGFPFEGRTHLEVIGKRLKSFPLYSSNATPRWLFLVLRIERCSHSLGFSEVILERPRGSTKSGNSEDPDLPQVSVVKGAKPVKPQTLKIHSAGEAAKGLAKIDHKIFVSRFEELIGKQLIIEPNEIDSYQTAITIKSGSKLLEKFGTSEGTFGHCSSRRLEAANQNADLKLSPDLEAFLKVISCLRTKYPIEYIRIINPSSENTQSEIYRFPANIMANGRWMRSWHFTEVGNPRRVIIAEIMAFGRFAYLFELEKKIYRKQSKNYCQAESFSTLLVSTHTVIPNIFLEKFLLETARNNRWPIKQAILFFDYSNQWEIETINHNYYETPASFAERILRKIRDLYGSADYSSIDET